MSERPPDPTPGSDEPAPEPVPTTGETPGAQPDPSADEKQAAGDPLSLARQVADSYRGGRQVESPRRRRPVSSPRRTSREDPTTVSHVLGEMVKDQGWSGRLSAQRVYSDWAGIVGPEIAQHSQVVNYADGIVSVRVDSTAWATQLKFLASHLVARLNAELGDGSVLRIEVEAPQQPSWKRGGRSIRGARGPRDTYG